MRLSVNGFPREVPNGCTVDALLRVERESPKHVLVEVNGEFLAPEAWDARVLAEGDRVEIILPAFGG